MKKYNFNAYRKETLHSLRVAKHWREDENHSWSITIPCDEYDDWVKWHAEIQYLNRLIRFRRIWDPRGWWKKIADWIELRC